MEENKAYIRENLYLPKKYFRLAGIASSLEIKLPKQKPTEESKILKLWDLTEHHIKVPRHYIPESNYSKYQFEFIDQRPVTFPKVSFNNEIKLRNSNQVKAFNALLSSRGGILNLNTGKGKTILALHRIAVGGQPSLIVVNNSFLRDQWLHRIERHLNYKDKIGIIEGPKMDWKRPIAVAMINTLANRSIDNELPDGFRDWFGSVFYDETHHLGAPVFSKSADVCLGNRYGLSATPYRADGLDSVVRYHLGDVFYSDMTYDLIPDIYFIETPVDIPITKWDNMFRLITRVSKNEKSLDFRYKWIKKAYDAGRKIIVVSSRLDQIKNLSERFNDGVAVITGETDYKERLQLVANSRIIFAITRLGLEGLDDEDIDTIFFSTPIGGDLTITENGREFLGNQVRQGMGRVLRDNGKDKKPEIYFFDDVNIEMLNQLTGQVKSFLRSEGFHFKITK